MSNTVIIQKSHRKDKKFEAIVNGTKTIQFGQAGASDFTQHGDLKRKDRYIQRHAKNEHWDDPLSSGFYSRWLLWNLPTLQESIRDMNRRFKNYRFVLRS